jgi:hypothetical protein
LQRRGAFVSNDRDQSWLLILLATQELKKIISGFVVDRKEDNVRCRRECIRNRPLCFDCASDPAQVFHKFDAFIVGLMDHLHAQTAKIPQDADRHYILRSSVDPLRQIR